MNKILESKIVAEIKERFPLSGLEVTDSPLIPAGMLIMQGDKQTAVINIENGNTVLFDSANFFQLFVVEVNREL